MIKYHLFYRNECFPIFASLSLSIFSPYYISLCNALPNLRLIVNLRFSRCLQLKGDIVADSFCIRENNGRVVFFAEEQFRFAWEKSRKMKSVVLVHVKAICTSVREVALFKERNGNGYNDTVTGRLSIRGKTCEIFSWERLYED